MLVIGVLAAVMPAGAGTTSALAEPFTVPDPPTNVTGSAGDGQVAVSWSAPAFDGGSPITGYTVTPFISGVAQTPRDFTSTATSQTITGLTNGTNYRFRVAAVNAAGASSLSAQSGSVRPTGLPEAPSDVTATVGGRSITISWTRGNDGGSDFVLEQVIVRDPGLFVVANPIVVDGSSSYTVTGLTAGVAHTIGVRTVNRAGSSAYTSAPGTYTPLGLPTAPTGVTAAAGNGSASVSWTAPSSDGGSAITGYTVTPWVGAVAQTPQTFTSTATAQVITGLTNGTTYTFRVAAVTALGTGTSSAASAAVTPTSTATPWAPFASWSALVDRIYLDLIGVAPTSAQRTGYVSRLIAKTLTPGGLVAELRGSSDHVNNVDPVTRLYRAYFLRIPDKGGLTYWIRQRRANGKKLNAISDSFAASSEFKTKYGSLTNRQFVELIYQNVLGRAGEASGVTYWTSRLDRKVNTRGQVMTGFSESNEYKTKQVAEVHVSVVFILLLGRAPNTAEFASLVTGLESSSFTVTDVAANIIGSSEYALHVA